MISLDQWINLPVGYNLDDHVGVGVPSSLRKSCLPLLSNERSQTDIEIAHPEVVFYDFYAAWDKPNADDKAQYLGESLATVVSDPSGVG